MARRKPKVPKTGAVFRLSAEENTLRQMPKYNAHAVGTGPHGDRKYSRAKMKRQWRKEDSAGASVCRLISPRVEAFVEFQGV